MKPFLQCSWMFETEAWAFLIPTGNFHFVRASVPERLALPASNVAVGSVFNLDSLFFKGILHQKIFYRLNLIFWIVMGCGIADLGRRGL